MLIAGGASNNDALASAELYDPVSGTFAPTSSMTTARAYHTATLLPSGQVLITGGTSGGVAVASAELYDPVSGAFSPTGSMAVARSGCTSSA